jgi:hypothetical protein
MSCNYKSGEMRPVSNESGSVGGAALSSEAAAGSGCQWWRQVAWRQVAAAVHWQIATAAVLAGV